MSIAEAVSGGLIASGDGPCASNPWLPVGGRRVPKDVEGENNEGPGPNDSGGEAALAGGLEAVAVGVAGGAPELNSAHRGHLRFVSVDEET